MNPFEQIVKLYQSPIRRFFLSQTGGDTQLSDDLAQDTFIKAYKNYDKFRGDSNISTWLYRIAYNTWYDYVRSHKITQDVTQGEGMNKPAREASVSEKMDINSALAILNDNERSCIVLQLMEGQPIDKISEITGMNSNTVKSHLSRGKEKLASYLRKNGYDRR